MEKRVSVREELAGKTEMNAVNEEDLFRRLEQIEAEGHVLASLSRKDWVSIWVTFFVLGVFPLLYYALKLA